MVMMIKHIDKIAREKNRDVLFLSFEKTKSTKAMFRAPNHQNSDYRTDTNRNEYIAWLDANDIKWVECGHIASEQGFMAYSGNIYVDVPWDTSNEKFVLLQQKVEDENGKPRNPLVNLWCCTLKQALENAHHDAPGFWEKWAETF